MKASELTVGAIVAVVDGSSKYDQRTNKATQCEVTGVPAKGHVTVKLLEDANSRLGQSIWNQEGWKKTGDLVRINTRMAWMPWESLGIRALNERTKRQQKEREEADSEERLTELQRRTDEIASGTTNPLRWAGAASYNTISSVEEYVRIPTEALEELLDRAEGP